MKEEKDTLRPETNNLRRIFIQHNYPSLKAMADELGENPIAFRKHFRTDKPVVPKIDKLERWARILHIDLAEFFLLGEKIAWPRPMKEHVPVHKKGLSYREANRLRDSLRHMVAEEHWDAEEISWFLTED